MSRVMGNLTEDVGAKGKMTNQAGIEENVTEQIGVEANKTHGKSDQIYCGQRKDD